MGEGGKAAGQAGGVHPTRVDGIARHSVRSPAPGPFVGEDDLGPLGPRVCRRAAVGVRRHLEAPEVETLRVHPARRDRHDVGLTGSTELRAEETRQSEGCQHGGRQRELAAVGSTAVGREERSGRMHQHVHVVVDRGDAFGERLHGVRIDHVQHDRLDASARTRARASRATASIRPRSRPSTQVVAPRRAAPRATARPIPEEAPVTITTRPASPAGGLQCSRRPRTAQPTRLKLPATLTSSAASTRRGRRRRAPRRLIPACAAGRPRPDQPSSRRHCP